MGTRHGDSAAKRSRWLQPVVLIPLLPSLVSLAYATASPKADPPAQPANLIDIRVNQTTTADQQEPTLAVDPTNPNNVLAAAKDWRTGPKQVWDYRSTDGGRTWTDGYPNLLPPELPNQSDPVVAFNAAGTGYLSVIGYNQSDFSVGGVFVARTTDVGATWQRAVEVSANTDDVFNDKEWLTVDRSNNRATLGNLYVTWTLFTQISPTRQRAQIVVSRSTDGGMTFSARQAISPESQGNVQGSSPVVGPGGELYVLYFSTSGSPNDEEEEQGGEGNIQVATVQAMQTGQKAAGALFVVKSTDGGATFAQPARVSSVSPPPNHLANANFRVFVLPSLAVDPNNGTLYATWNDYGAGNSDVSLATSTDGGKTWGAPKRVNDDPASSDSDQFFPAAAVGKDSTLHLFWLDTRDDPSKELYRPYYTRSTDGGQTFMKNAPLSTSLSDPGIGFEGTLLGDYVALDISSDGSRFYATWVDTRNGNQDIYMTALDTTSPPPPQSLSTPAQSPVSTPLPQPSPQPLTGFNDRAFITRWEGPDRPVLLGKAQRPWVWGPASFAAASEPYKQGQHGTREVLYFDKARMEINNPQLDPSDPAFVTNGLLVVELISGRIQVGNTEFEAARPPSNAPVAGDFDSPDALTYASLASVASLNGDNRAGDRTGQGVTAVLNRNGEVAIDPSKETAVKIALYEPHLGHNIPDVFWNFMNATGPIYNGRFGTYSDGKVLDWVSALGYPITEPYWTNVKIGGAQKSVLVQAFQRRVLTYVAANPPGWQVEMGNVGRHYFDWRYGPGVQPQAAQR